MKRLMSVAASLSIIAGLLFAGTTIAAAPATALPKDSAYQLPVTLVDQAGKSWDWRSKRGSPQLVAAIDDFFSNHLKKSNITQQLVKNLFLSHEQSMGRKVEELLLALDMEARYSKEQILELYLNTIYFGSDFYGIAEAAHGYFGKRPADLSLAEAAMLAGLPNAPSLYSPYVDYDLAKKRQAIVLDAMVRSGLAAPSVAEKAKKDEPHFVRKTR